VGNEVRIRGKEVLKVKMGLKKMQESEEEKWRLRGRKEITQSCTAGGGVKEMRTKFPNTEAATCPQYAPPTPSGGGQVLFSKCIHLGLISEIGI
jgi:hypothetical protein